MTNEQKYHQTVLSEFEEIRVKITCRNPQRCSYGEYLLLLWILILKMIAAHVFVRFIYR